MNFKQQVKIQQLKLDLFNLLLGLWFGFFGFCAPLMIIDGCYEGLVMTFILLVLVTLIILFIFYGFYLRILRSSEV